MTIRSRFKAALALGLVAAASVDCTTTTQSLLEDTLRSTVQIVLEEAAQELEESPSSPAPSPAEPEPGDGVTDDIVFEEDPIDASPADDGAFDALPAG